MEYDYDTWSVTFSFFFFIFFYYVGESQRWKEYDRLQVCRGSITSILLSRKLSTPFDAS